MTGAPRRPFENAYVVPRTGLVAGEYPSRPPGDPAGSAEEKLARVLDAGLTTLVDLTTTDDPLAPYEPILRALAATRGIDVAVHRLPIPDMDVCDAAGMRAILDAIDAAHAAGERVYVHCWGGVGRTGTVVGCHLVRHGLAGDEALAEVARLFATMSPAKRSRHPEGSPQTAAQRALVRGWAAHDRPSSGPSRRDRVHGCLLGGAVGDALGWPVEFLSLDAIRARFGPDGIRDLALAPGGVGAVTDDTQMALFTAEGLLRAATDGGDVATAVWHAYRRWYVSQGGPPAEPPRAAGWLLSVPALHARRAPGATCLGALAGGRPGRVGAPTNDSRGCGGVMRAAPVGLLSADPFRDGIATAALTHGHPSGYLPAGALALMVARLLRGDPLEEAAEAALRALAREPGHEPTSDAIRHALDAARTGLASAEGVERLGAGWTGEEALAIALGCALAAGDDLAAGLRLAVNHSGDSDSTGAIAGNLLGAALGVDAIPRAWRERVELREEIAALADDIVAGPRDDAGWRDRYPAG